MEAEERWKEACRSNLVDGSFTKQGNLLMSLVLGDYKMSRPWHLPKVGSTKRASSLCLCEAVWGERSEPQHLLLPLTSKGVWCIKCLDNKVIEKTSQCLLST